MDEVFFTLDPFGFSVRYRLAEQIDSRMLLRKNKGSGDDGLNGNACRSRKKSWQRCWRGFGIIMSLS